MHQNALNLRDDFCRITVDTLYILVESASKLNTADFWVFSEDDELRNDKTVLIYSYYE